MITKENIEKNKLVKNFLCILKEIDKDVTKIEYLPSSITALPKNLILINFKEKGPRYLEINNVSPFKFISEIMKAMDNYNLDVQFLSKKKTQKINEIMNQLLNKEEFLINELKNIENISVLLTPKMKEDLIIPCSINDYIQSDECTILDKYILYDWLMTEDKEKEYE